MCRPELPLPLDQMLCHHAVTGHWGNERLGQRSVCLCTVTGSYAENEVSVRPADPGRCGGISTRLPSSFQINEMVRARSTYLASFLVRGAVATLSPRVYLGGHPPQAPRFTNDAQKSCQTVPGTPCTVQPASHRGACGRGVGER